MDELSKLAEKKLPIEEQETYFRIKNQLELKIFKLKKGRIAKMFANCAGEQQEKKTVSVFNEHVADATAIPQNEILFKNYIMAAMHE